MFSSELYNYIKGLIVIEVGMHTVILVPGRWRRENQESQASHVYLESKASLGCIRHYLKKLMI